LGEAYERSKIIKVRMVNLGRNQALSFEGGAMLTYLFDASAAVEIYAPRDDQTNGAARYIPEQKTTYCQAALFIPNICIAEVFNTLARKYFKPREGEAIDRERYERHLAHFREDVHWGKTLYPYDVNRYHIIAADRIMPVEHDIASKDARDHMSTFDILVIAMACELAYLGQREDTFLVTCDYTMKQVSDELKNSGRRRLMVAGTLGTLDRKRWVPPPCLYLPRLARGELKHLPTQPAFNL
jgi:hypothetical protein